MANSRRSSPVRSTSSAPSNGQVYFAGQNATGVAVDDASHLRHNLVYFRAIGVVERQ